MRFGEQYHINLCLKRQHTHIKNTLRQTTFITFCALSEAEGMDIKMILMKKKVVVMFLSVVVFSICGCGSDSSENDTVVPTEKKASNTEKSDTLDIAEDSFVMDRKEQEGFMQKGDSKTEVPKGYIGIYSVEDLYQIKENKKGKYILMADLDASGSAWKSVDLEGTFDGNYHIISGLNSCLFNEFQGGGTIQNLGLENVNAVGAALVLCTESGNIDNCYVTGNVQGKAGLVCLIYAQGNVNIRNCYNKADIAGEETAQAHVQYIDSAGGIAGYVNLSDTNKDIEIFFFNCENYGSLAGAREVGGIIGKIDRNSSRGYYLEGKISFTISNSFNYGMVSGTDSTGGILGYINAVNASNANDGILQSNYTIKQCANYNEISGIGNSGGICGEINLMTNKGYSHALIMEIEDCLNTATINCTDEKDVVKEGGGVCGEIGLNYGTCKINRCLNIGNTQSEYYSKPNINNSEPVYECSDYYTTKHMSIKDMKDISTNLPNFSYPDIWGIDEWYNGFPHPYGNAEYSQVSAYSDAKKKEAAENMLKDADESEIILRQRYTDMLAHISLGSCWPEDKKRENQYSYLYEFSEEADNYYDIADVNEDGQEELLVKCPCVGIVVYSYDLKKNEIKKEDTAENVEEWEKIHVDSAGVQWKALRCKNYSIHTQTYISYYLKLLEKDTDMDVGCIYINTSGDNRKEVMDTLEREHNIEFEETDKGISYKGNCEGKEVFSFYTEEVYSLTYENEQINGMTLIGVYPGMDKEEAEKKLKKYGFNKCDESDSWTKYQTGGSTGNYFVTCRTENGKVISISIWAGNLYTG